ncbi:MAG: ORF6N domain-containing protein [Bacteroidetes bacterium]|nr:MAG: ORF6N domain-containing protein [Bacteroidota bacterium]
MKNQIIKTGDVQSQIYTIRGLQVMLDSDLAKLYGVQLKRLNEQVKRNQSRFPFQYRFQLSKKDYESLRSQFATLENQPYGIVEKKGRGQHRKHNPYVFTEQGVSMLSAVLHSEKAIQVSIQIIDAFVEMRKFLLNNASLFQRIDGLELKQLEYDKKFEILLKAMEQNTLKPKQGIFFNGQVFDAYLFVANMIRSANKSIVLVDNYVDDTVLSLLVKRGSKVTAKIFTKQINKQLALDIKKHNAQYPEIIIEIFDNTHDRFMIIDDKTIYHIGASLKDLGKKWFAFSQLDFDAIDFLSNIK